MNAELVLERDHFQSFRSPGSPFSSRINFGTRNIDIPRVPGAEPGTRARTRWMMFSVRS